MIDESLTSEIVEVITESEFYGMQTFDQSILHLYEKGQISVSECHRQRLKSSRLPGKGRADGSRDRLISEFSPGGEWG